MERIDLEKLADSLDIDLEVLDQTMKESAKREPDGIERALIDSNLPETARLQVGCLIVMLLNAESEKHELRGRLLQELELR